MNDQQELFMAYLLSGKAQLKMTTISDAELRIDCQIGAPSLCARHDGRRFRYA